MSILLSRKRLTVELVGACVCALLLMATLVVRADTERTAADYAADPAAMLDAYRHIEVASVSDAAEQLFHQKRFLSHHMRPIFPAKFAGTALTVKLVKQEGADPSALNGMLEAIDRGGKDSVYVMQIEGGDDIAGMGGLMGTAMYSRGYAGAVIGGGVRDLQQLMRINFPVFSTGVVPSTAVGHYRFAAMNVPIVCGGVDVAPNDIVVADADGVVVIPRAKAVDVLQLAQSLDNKEHSTYPIIEKFHSIVEAVKRFGRI